MITREAYEKGIRCRGMCFICGYDINACYQYNVDTKGTKYDAKKVPKYDNNVVSKTEYDKGIRCDGLCAACRHNINVCYQYNVDFKGANCDVQQRDNTKANKKVIELQNYEIENVLKALEHAVVDEFKNCKWEMQPNGRYGYTPNKKIKQLNFTINSIKRQIKGG